jgi:hypothetical protein
MYFTNNCFNSLVLSAQNSEFQKNFLQMQKISYLQIFLGSQKNCLTSFFDAASWQNFCKFFPRIFYRNTLWKNCIICRSQKFFPEFWELLVGSNQGLVLQQKTMKSSLNSCQIFCLLKLLTNIFDWVNMEQF